MATAVRQRRARLENPDDAGLVAFEDRGCGLFGSCLNCPRPMCALDEPAGNPDRRIAERGPAYRRQLAAVGL